MHIEAQQISVAYGTHRVIKSLSLSIRAGEFVGLIGPNGAGKSTLLRALIGLHPLQTGTLTWNGMDARSISRNERARAISYLAQSQNAIWPLRASDIVMLGRLPHRTSFAAESEADRVAVERALRAVEMEAYGHHILDHLSGGERARILLARALAVEAQLLFVDEPVAALDPLHQLRVMDLLKLRVRNGEGVVVVLHDLALAMRYCDRLVLLDKGSIRMDGAPHLLTDNMIADVYGVDVFRGKCEGQEIVIPWRVSEP